MRKIRVIVLVLYLQLLAVGSTLVAFADGNGDTTVYVTDYGDKYHYLSCHYLKSVNKITLEEAYVNGYTPCSHCNPPVYTGTAKRKETRNHSDEYSSASKEKKKTGLFVGIIAVGGIAVYILYRIVSFKREKERQEEERRRREAEARQRWQEEKEKLLKELSGRTVREAAKVPEGIRFVNGYPADNNDSTYGSYTVYLSDNGKCYHEKAGCCSARHPVHVFRVMGAYAPCSKCCHGRRWEVPDWFTEYDRLQKACKEYGVDPGKGLTI